MGMLTLIVLLCASAGVKMASTEPDHIDDCPLGFSIIPGFSASCYRFVTSAMTWNDAGKFCRASTRGAHLAVVDSSEEDRAIIDHLQSIQMDSAFISGQTLDPKNCSSPYHWKPFPGIHIPMNYTNWFAGEPNCQRNTQTCLQYLRFRWDDYNCESRRGFVCEFDRSNELDGISSNQCDMDLVQEFIKSEIQNLKQQMTCAPNQQMCACPDGFFRLPGYNGHSCYRIVYDNFNWADAGARCRNLTEGSHLLVIENQSENTAIVEYLTSIKDTLRLKCNDASVWTSGQLLTRGNCTSGYVWKPYPRVNVPMTFTNWAPGEPQCHTTLSHDSVQFWSTVSFKWDDQNYITKLCQICEYDNRYKE